MPTGAKRCLGTAENINELFICNEIGEKILLKCLPHLIKEFSFS